MPSTKPDILAAGHVCLDIIPGFTTGGGSIAEILVPGKLIDIDGALFATGGSAANTGLALHRLGFGVGIMGKVGDDAFGKGILDIIGKNGPELIRDMIVSQGETSSFTLIINPPGIDRVFLHSGGTNYTFCSADVKDETLEGLRLFHFGYPPLMRRFYLDDGLETKTLLARAKKKGATTSLDMARPDPEAPAGKIDWLKFLVNVLPVVDVFQPSFDEIIYMLDRPVFDRLLAKANGGNLSAHAEYGLIRDTAEKLLAMGPAMVGFKFGDEGYYLKTTSDAGRLKAMGPLAPKEAAAWTGREIMSPCKQVKVAGTTGAGDCTIAGFLGALLKGYAPQAAVAMAVAVGGASVEALDSVSGVPTWEKARERIAAGWPNAGSVLIPKHWKKSTEGTWEE